MCICQHYRVITIYKLLRCLVYLQGGQSYRNLHQWSKFVLETKSTNKSDCEMEDVSGARSAPEDLSFEYNFVLVCRMTVKGRNENAAYARHNQLLSAGA